MGCNNREFDVILVLPSFSGIEDSNLGLASIESYLKFKGLRCKTIKNSEVHGCIDQSDVFGISVLDHTHQIAKTVTRTLKDKTVIWGGATASSLPEYLLKENPDLDYVILGEGEERLFQLLSSFNKPGIFEYIDGIAYRDENRNIVIKEAVDFINMNDLPIAEDLVLLGDFVMIDMVRGCYGRCRYCQETFKMRFKSPENTVRDIAHWYEKGYRKFYLGNANSMANGKLLSAVIELLEEKKLEVKLCIVGRPNDYHRNFDIVERIFKSEIIDLHMLEIGVESNSENGLKLLGRKIPPAINEEITEKLLYLQKNYSVSTAILANMILFPHFDMELDDFVANVKFIGDYGCSRYSLTPRVIGLSNSAIWKEMIKKGFGAVSDGLRIIEYDFTDPIVDKLYCKIVREINENLKERGVANNNVEFMYCLHDKAMEFYKSGDIRESVLEYIDIIGESVVKAGI